MALEVNMSSKSNQTNETPKRTKKTKRKKRRFSIIKFLILMIMIAVFVIAGAAIGIISASIRNAPTIDPTIILSMLSESSTIVDDRGNVIEIIQTTEDRKIISIEEMPEHLLKAFIAIEDHRFRDHFGIDPVRIMGSAIHNIRVGDLTAQGASTITQQLAKNIYLTRDQSFDRKIKEMYLAIEMERKLTKDQILEYYLNTIPLGQSSNGVQAAAFTYFSKDVSELTLAEAALLAGIPRADSRYAPFTRVVTGNDGHVDPEDIVGYMFVSGTQFTCVYNHTSVERQRVVLKRMLELEWITQREFDEAMAQDIRASLNPGQRQNTEISSYFTDYVKSQVVQDLMAAYGYTREQADNLLFTGGLTIYSTMDFSIQKTLEDTFENFAELLLGDLTNERAPYAVDWRHFRWNSDGTSSGTLDGNENILNESGHIIYYKKDNIFTENNELYLLPSEYEFDEDGNLVITSRKFSLHPTIIDVIDLYTIKDNYLSTHIIGGLNIGDHFEIIESRGNRGTFMIFKELLQSRDDFYRIDEEERLIINPLYYFYDHLGILQPQSSAVIIDHRTGAVKALIGGRNIEVSKSFNRATRATRQPGSVIKPISVYVPALDNGHTAATVTDDIPRYNDAGERWPKNWYEHQAYKYWGLTTLRKAVEYSLNTIAVKTLESIGLDQSMEYMARMGIIDRQNPETDNFVTPEENRAYNDYNLAAMALGGFTRGLTNLEITAAYGAIANDGIYQEPYVYTKVVDRNGRVILEKEVNSNIVVTPQVAFIMTDILRTTVTQGLSHRAALPRDYNIEVAGKTGTTNDSTDIWYIGYSPYYVSGIWVGNDNAQIKLSTGSGSTSRLWGNIMAEVHKNLPPAQFERPEGLLRMNVCADSGLLPTDLCALDPRGSRVISEYFVRGTEPSTFCDAHVQVTVCTGSGLLPSPFCPLDQLETIVAISRETLYNPIYFPDTKDANHDALVATYEYYQQVKADIKGLHDFSDREIENIFDGRIKLINGIIVTVDGINVVDMHHSGIRTQDFTYQVPVNTCTIHNRYHWNVFLSGTDQGDNDDDSDDPNGDSNGSDSDIDPDSPPVDDNPDDDNPDDSNGDDNDNDNGAPENSNGNQNGDNN